MMGVLTRKLCNRFTAVGVGRMVKRIVSIGAVMIGLALLVLGGFVVIGDQVNDNKREAQLRHVMSESSKRELERQSSKRNRSSEMTRTSTSSSSIGSSSVSSSSSSESSSVTADKMTNVQADAALMDLSAEERGALILREWQERTAATNNWLAEVLKSDIHVFLQQQGNSESFGIPVMVDGGVMGVKIDGDNRIVSSRNNGDAGNFTMSMRDAYRKFFAPSEVAYTEQVAQKITTDPNVFHADQQQEVKKNQEASAKAQATTDQDKLNRAKAWVAVMGTRIADDNNGGVDNITTSTVSAGAPVASVSADKTVTFPTDVTVLTGTPLAEGMLTYHDNGNGTITVYDVPTHFQDPAWNNPDSAKQMAQHIVDTAHTVNVSGVSDGDAQKIVALMN